MKRLEFLKNCNQNTDVRIDGFINEYRWLSNFHVSPAMYDGIMYPSSENAYQAAKTMDLSERSKFTQVTPAEARKLGKSLALRPEWDTVKYGIMWGILLTKFGYSRELRQKLASIGVAELVEGNWWGDTYWGVCEGKGQNKLGRLLMLIRDNYRK